MNIQVRRAGGRAAGRAGVIFFSPVATLRSFSDRQSVYSHLILILLISSTVLYITSLCSTNMYVYSISRVQRKRSA